MPLLKVPAVTVVLKRRRDRRIEAYYEMQIGWRTERVKFSLGRKYTTNIDTAKTMVRDLLAGQVDQLTIKECE